MAAAEQGHLETVRALLDGGANRHLRNVDKKTGKGKTALDYAVGAQQPALAELLRSASSAGRHSPAASGSSAQGYGSQWNE
jgi:ankyrin repeat protein